MSFVHNLCSRAGILPRLIAEDWVSAWVDGSQARSDCSQGMLIQPFRHGELTPFRDHFALFGRFTYLYIYQYYINITYLHIIFIYIYIQLYTCVRVVHKQIKQWSLNNVAKSVGWFVARDLNFSGQSPSIAFESCCFIVCEFQNMEVSPNNRSNSFKRNIPLVWIWNTFQDVDYKQGFGSLSYQTISGYSCDTSSLEDAYFLTALQRGTKIINADAVGDFKMGFS